MMSCIIIEDQLPAQRILKKYIEDVGSLELVGTYSDALQAMEALKTGDIELMFLDIHLPKLSGMDFLRSLKDPPQVILTTAFQEFALEGYELNVVDYLLKPYSFQRFVKAVAKVRKKEVPTQKQDGTSEEGPSNEIFLRSGYDHIRIAISDINYLRTDNDYTEVHLDNKRHLSAEPLKDWEGRLDPKSFARVHRSYMVNVAKVQRVSGNRLFLQDGTEVPIGRAYKSDFTDRFVR